MMKLPSRSAGEAWKDSQRHFSDLGLAHLRFHLPPRGPGRSASPWLGHTDKLTSGHVIMNR